MDNQALFDASGKPLDSMNIWRYVRTGAQTSSVTVDGLKNISLTIQEGDALILPDTVLVQYNKGDVQENVTWNTRGIRVDGPGEYVIKDEVTFSKSITDGA